MKILLLLCEGPHDIALLYKIVRYGVKANDVASLKINQFPEIIYGHFISLLKNHDYENSRLVGRPELPTVLVLGDGDESVHILIYSMGGDSTLENWIKQIQTFKDLLGSQLSNDQISISLGLFFDADTSADSRLQKCKENFIEIIPEIDGVTLENKICRGKDSFNATGLYVICNSEGLGNIENVLLPLMILNNENIFEEARNYLHNHIDHNRPTTKKFKKSYHEHKSIIGIAGQLQYSGVANQSIIKQSDYITEDKVLSDTNCIAITQFLSSLISAL